MGKKERQRELLKDITTRQEQIEKAIKALKHRYTPEALNHTDHETSNVRELIREAITLTS
jgi:hypothetical protein